MNEELVNTTLLKEVLQQRNAEAEFDRLLVRMGIGFAASFFLSAVLNFFLAQWVIKSPAGTTEFNAELAKMHLLGWPVIVVPSLGLTGLIFWHFIRELKRLTQVNPDQFFKTTR